jgi:hypothetical protein
MSFVLTAGEVAKHELRHIYGAAIALVAIGTEKQYGEADVYYDVKEGHRAGEGEAAVHFQPQRDAQKVAALAALAPIAKAGDAVLTLVRNKDWSALQKAGDLSQKDLDLAVLWDGPPTMFPRVALGVVLLEKHLGFSRFHKHSKLLREAIAAGITEPFKLTDFVPYAIAKKFHGEAKSLLEQELQKGIAPILPRGAYLTGGKR